MRYDRQLEAAIMDMSPADLYKSEVITQRIVAAFDQMSRLNDQEELLVHNTVTAVFMELKKWNKT